MITRRKTNKTKKYKKTNEDKTKIRNRKKLCIFPQYHSFRVQIIISGTHLFQTPWSILALIRKLGIQISFVSVESHHFTLNLPDE